MEIENLLRLIRRAGEVEKSMKQMFQEANPRLIEVFESMSPSTQAAVVNNWFIAVGAVVVANNTKKREKLTPLLRDAEEELKIIFEPY